MDRREAAYWLALAFHLGTGQRRERNGLVLVAARRHGLGLLDLVRMDPEDLPEELRRFGEVHRRLLEADGRVSAQAFVVERLTERGITLLPITDDRYPRHVGERLTPPASPTVLTVAGDPALLAEPGVAVSGSRKAGPEGLAFARAMGRALGERGIPVVSGLAPGVDQHAAEGAFEAGGRVVGIAAEGILQARWARRPEVSAGRLAVLSEFAPDQRCSGGLAMARNRTIAAFSRALVVADCVAPGGTSDQVEVHRKLGLPVAVRRGTGEGEAVAGLSRLEGVRPFPWESGPVELPGWLTGRTGRAIEVSVVREAGQIRLVVCAPEGAPEDDVIESLRSAWTEASARALPRADDSGSPAHQTEGPDEGDIDGGGALTGEPVLATRDPVLAALEGGARMSIAELSRATGWTPDRVRRATERLVRAGKVTGRKEGRALRYRIESSSDPVPPILLLFRPPGTPRA